MQLLEAARIAADLKKAQMRQEMDEKRLSSEEFRKGIDVGIEAMEIETRASNEEQNRVAKGVIEGAKIAADVAKESRNERDQ